MPLTRREFLQAVAVLTGGALAGASFDFTVEKQTEPSPKLSAVADSRYSVVVDGERIHASDIDVSVFYPSFGYADGDGIIEYMPLRRQGEWDMDIYVASDVPMDSWVERLGKTVSVEFMIDDILTAAGNGIVASVGWDGVKGCLVLEGVEPMVVTI